MAVDLHTHSNFSDGTVPPAELAAMAHAAGLSAIALTDHDTTGGIAEFMAQQQLYSDLELIPGVELSSILGARELHIVGLFIDPENRKLQDFLRDMQEKRLQRAEDMIRKLAQLDYIVSWDDLRNIGGCGDVPGRPHFAQVLIKKYNFPDTQTVFERLLKRGCAGYVPRELPTPQEAIKIIKEAQGVAVWAHPFNARRNENNFISRTVKELKLAGLDALEAYYSEYTKERTAKALQLASEHRLALSGGSDFHGEVHKKIRLGSGYGTLNVPDEVLKTLERARQAKVLIV